MSHALRVHHAVFPAGDHGRDRHVGLLLRIHRHLHRARAGLLLLRHHVHQTVPGAGGQQRRPTRAAVRRGGRAAHAAGECTPDLAASSLTDTDCAVTLSTAGCCCAAVAVRWSHAVQDEMHQCRLFLCGWSRIRAFRKSL